PHHRMETAPTSRLPASPMVSVVMATFNHRPYIEKAVQSVLAQETDFPVELLIGEDCSIDGTRELVCELARRHPDRIRVITSDRNVGAHPNVARLERASRGKYLAYCEGDDWWHDPRKLAKQVAFLEARPGWVMVHSHCDRYYVATGRLLRNDLTVPSDLDDARAYEDILLGVRYPLTVTVMVVREALMKVVESCPECLDARWPMGDTQRWLELARLGRVGCIHESLATTNVLPESAGQSRDPRKRLRFYLAARELKLHYLAKYPVAPELARTVRERLALVLLQHAHQAGAPEVADQMFAEYAELRGRASWRARWLRWGSRSAERRRLVAPLVMIDNQLRRLRRRLGRGAQANGASSNAVAVPGA
ncbi:MAG TPA: glycosyltransferase, partial [Methylomirabilota bacterium]|nr:glycosyltransferase [Methylomirabilota bacterium]